MYWSEWSCSLRHQVPTMLFTAGTDDPLDRCSRIGAVVWAEVLGGFTEDFPMDLDVGRDYGATASHRLDSREVKTFSNARA